VRCERCHTHYDPAWRWCPDCGLPASPDEMDLRGETGPALAPDAGYSVDWVIDAAPTTHGGGPTTAHRDTRVARVA
jgi:hypothetical protein